MAVAFGTKEWPEGGVIAGYVLLSFVALLANLRSQYHRGERRHRFQPRFQSREDDAESQEGPLPRLSQLLISY